MVLFTNVAGRRLSENACDVRRTCDRILSGWQNQGECKRGCDHQNCKFFFSFWYHCEYLHLLNTDVLISDLEIIRL